ncbi:MAG: YfhO family protein [bacterium]|nr:YfhO family protein [bacterium]
MKLRPARKDVVLDVCILAAVFAVLFSRYIFTDIALPAGDPYHDILPESQNWWKYTAANLVRGIVPLWNPFAWCGYPHLAMPHSACFYPATLLYALPSFPLILKIDMLGHAFLCGLFGYLLGRDVFRHRYAGLLAGLLILTSGQFMGIEIGWPYRMHVLTYVPLAFFLLRRVLRTCHTGWAVGLAFVLMLQAFAGDTQTFFYELLGLGAYTLVELGRQGVLMRERKRRLVAKAALALAAVLLGLTLAGVQLAPFWELLSQESIRSMGVSGVMEVGGYRVHDLWRIAKLIPSYAMALMLLGFVLRGSSERWVYVALAVFACLVAMGEHSPAAKLLLNLPVLRSARGHERIMFLTSLSYPLLAAYGLKGIRGRTRHRAPDGSAQWLPCVALASLAVAPTLGTVLGLKTFAFFHARWALSGATRIAAGVLGAGTVLCTRGSRAGIAIAFGACLFAQIFASSLGNQLNHTRADTYALDHDFLTFSKMRGENDRIAIFSEVTTQMRELPQFAGMVTGDRVLGGYGPLTLQRYYDWFQQVAGAPLREGRSMPIFTRDWLRPASARALDMLNVRYVIAQWKGFPELAYPDREILAGTGRFRKTRIGGLNIYENLKVWPRAFTVHEVRACESEADCLTLIKSGELDLRKTAVLAEAFDQSRLGPAKGSEHVAIVDSGANHVDCEVLMSAPGLVILSDMYYPGWRARVDDGPDEPVICVNGMLRATPVPSGRHTVSFYYWPNSFRLGLLLTGCAFSAVGLWAGATLLYLRRSAKRSP